MEFSYSLFTVKSWMLTLGLDWQRVCGCLCELYHLWAHSTKFQAKPFCTRTFTPPLHKTHSNHSYHAQIPKTCSQNSFNRPKENLFLGMIMEIYPREGHRKKQQAVEEGIQMICPSSLQKISRISICWRWVILLVFIHGNCHIMIKTQLYISG